MARASGSSILTRSHLTRPIAGCAMIIVAAVMIVAGTGLSDAGRPAAGVDPGSYEVFTGSVDDFYQVPDPLPAGAPGQLIRVQAVSSDATTTTMRIMYHSTDSLGHDRAVTGKMTYPNGAAPAGGWPVISYANGTIGLAPQCALSRNASTIGDLGIGGVAVASDYIGEGPPNTLQEYLNRVSEGDSVLDAVRAARNFADAHAGTRFLVLGGSQGGHGALAASELASTYAPELDLLGTVSLAPAAMFDRTYGPVDEIVTRVVTAMGLMGMVEALPSLQLSDYVTPAAMPAFDVMRTQCIGDVESAVLGVKGDFWTHDPRQTEPARSVLLANDVGNAASPSPVLLVQGTDDYIVNPLRTADLYERMCGVGQVTQFVSVPGADHNTVLDMSMATVQAWLQDRLAGRAAEDTCATDHATTTTTTTTTEPPTTEAPTTVPPTTVTATAVEPTIPLTTLPNVGPATTSTSTSTTARVGAITAAVTSSSTPSLGSTTTAAQSASSLPATGASIGQLLWMGLLISLGGVVLIGSSRRRTASG